MIGVYAGLSVKPEHVEEFLKTIEPLVTASRKDEGNGFTLDSVEVGLERH